MELEAEIAEGVYCLLPSVIVVPEERTAVFLFWRFAVSLTWRNR